MIIRVYYFLGNVFIFFGLFMFLIQPVVKVAADNTFVLFFTNSAFSLDIATLGILIRIERAIAWYRYNSVSKED